MIFLALAPSQVPPANGATPLIIVAGDSAGYVYAVDVASGSLLWNRSLGGDVRSVAISDNGQFIVVGTSSEVAFLGRDGTTFWGKTLGVNPTDPTDPFQYDTRLVSLSEDGAFIIAAHNDGTVRLYDKGGDEIWSDVFSATSVALAASGGSAVAGGSAGSRYYSVGSNGAWDSADSSAVWTISATSIRKVAISASGKYVVVGGRVDGYAGLYDETGTEVWGYRNYTNRITIDISRDGTGVAAGNDDSAVTLGAQLLYFSAGSDGTWSQSDGSPIWIYRASYGADDDIRAVAFSQNGKCIASGGSGNYARTYLHRIVVSTPAYNSSQSLEDETIDVSFDGRYVVAADTQSGNIRLYDTMGGQDPAWTFGAFGLVRSVAIDHFEESEVWVPDVGGALVAGALTVGLTGGVSAMASAVSNPDAFPSSSLAGKINGVFPDTLKKWLQEFISSKRKLVVEHRTGFLFRLTRREIASYAIALSALTLAFSYAKAGVLEQILPLIPTVLATSIIVEFVKNYSIEVTARRLGIWTEHRLWYLGLATFLVSAFALKAPFSSPSRLSHHSPKFTSRSLGLVSSASVVIPLAFAAIFFELLVSGFIVIGNIGLVMCLTMALFDTIPIPPMNGKDIYDWNKFVWIALFATTFALYILCLLLL
jgi:WD40 repeat protein